MMREIDFHVPPENVLLVGFRNEKLNPLVGKTLADVAQERNKSPEETILDLIYEDDSRIQVVYFSMSEENIKKKVALPYMKSSIRPTKQFFQFIQILLNHKWIYVSVP